MKWFKRLLKIALGLVALVIVLVALLCIFKDAILRSVLEHQIHAQTGMPVYIGSFQSTLTSGDVRILDLRLYNTSQFGGSAFVQIPELHLQYDLDSLATNKMGFKLVRLNLSEMNIVRNAKGELNIDLKPLQRKVHGPGPAAPQPKGPKLPKIEFGGIGTLDLTLGKVRYTDMKTPANSYVRDLGVQDEVFKNIKSQDDCCGVILLLMWRHGVNFGGGGVGGMGDFLPLKF